MSKKTIFSSYQLGKALLSNKVVMAPMTRSRAINNLPNDLMATYYGQRAAAGLIVTEGVSPSPNGLGYSRIPGIFSTDQVIAWKKITDAVHAKGGVIFMQLMHTGRIAHIHNLPKNGKIVAPSAEAAPGQMWTDLEGMQDHSVPEELTNEGIQNAKKEFVQAAINAIEAGFDGVELHSANGYLLEQFLSPHTNKRIDAYGGSIENRSRLVLEVAQEVATAIGKNKVGIRLSPYGTFNDMPHYSEIDATYTYLAQELNKIGIVYIHLVDHSAGGAPEVPIKIKQAIREKFTNTLILSGGYNLERAEEDLSSGFANLIAFGKPFLNNPDLIDRFKTNRPLHLILDADTLYTPGEKGYTDYPVYTEEAIVA